MPELEESVQSKRARSVLRHLTAATATGNVVVEQAWAAMEQDYDDDDDAVRTPPYGPSRTEPRLMPPPLPFAFSRFRPRAPAHGCGLPCRFDPRDSKT